MYFKIGTEPKGISKNVSLNWRYIEIFTFEFAKEVVLNLK
jgi:hypothetical protein